MPIKRIQKAFDLSSETSKNIIEIRLEEISRKTQRSSSNVIEGILLDALLPHDEDVKQILTRSLFTDDDDALSHTIMDLFLENASGNNWVALHDNFRALVQYSFDLTYKASIDAKKSEAKEQLLYYFRTLSGKINDDLNYCIEPIDKNNYKKELKRFEALIASLEATGVLRAKDALEIILNCWDILRSWTVTYQLLGEILSRCRIKCTPNNSAKLLKILDNIVNEWSPKYNLLLPDNPRFMYGDPSIRFTYSNSTKYSDAVELHANGAIVGILTITSDWLIWSPDLQNCNVKFQFRKLETFVAVVKELQRYKNEHGYRYLVIWTYNNGIASLYLVLLL